jgi:hypothetical protein
MTPSNDFEFDYDAAYREADQEHERQCERADNDWSEPDE